MVISHAIYLAILAALVAERVFELWLSNRNAQLAFARGGVEFGRGQYRIMIAFHTTFIAACTIESMLRTAAFPTALVIAALAGEIAAQTLRYWAVATLGEKWNTRVIVIPGSEPVTSGPYRYIRHPNYAAVVKAHPRTQHFKEDIIQAFYDGIKHKPDTDLRQRQGRRRRGQGASFPPRQLLQRRPRVRLVSLTHHSKHR
jgi:isoprenylcysteine carboxyl methyltransferase (ICMT) family protein YpbQ